MLFILFFMLSDWVEAELPMLNRKVVVGIIVILVILVGTVGYYNWYGRSAGPAVSTTVGTTGPAVVIPHPDTLVYQVALDPQFLDPATDYEVAGAGIIENVYEPLIGFKGASLSQFEPVLATELPTISPDGLTYTFMLRQNVKFQDGTPFNASAAKYSLDRNILVGEPNSYSQYFGPVRGVATYLSSNKTQADANAYLAAGGFEVVDQYTLRMHLDTPFAPILSLLAQPACGGIVSPTAVESHGGIVPGKHNDWMDTNMVGTGPYKFVEWVLKQRIVLQAFDGYWRDPPKIKQVIIQTVAELQSRELALFTGDADIISLDPTNAFDIIQKVPWLTQQKLIPRTDLSFSPAGTGLTVLSGPQAVYYFTALNDRFPPLNNKDFRYGLHYAFNYTIFIDDVLNGFGQPLNSVIPTGFFAHPTTPYPFQYDLVKAKEYILKAKAAGAYQDGAKMTVLYAVGDEVTRRVGLMLQDALTNLNVGITFELQGLDWPALLRQNRSGAITIFSVAEQPDFPDQDSVITTFGSSKGVMSFRFHSSLGPNYDAMIDQARTTTDSAQRIQLYNNISNAINENAHFILLAQSNSFRVMRDWVQVKMDPDLHLATILNPYLFDPELYVYDMSKGYTSSSLNISSFGMTLDILVTDRLGWIFPTLPVSH